MTDIKKIKKEMATEVEQVQKTCDAIIAEANEYADSDQCQKDIDASIAQMEAERPWFEKVLDRIFG